MADVRDLAINHDRHDLLLVAALASDDAAPAERDRAEQLVARCDACAELARDLRAIALATTAVSLPVPERPRAFALSPADARRLRPAGWRAVLGRLGSPGWSFTRPLAAGLTTLGLAGLLVAALPGGLGGAAATPLRIESAPGAVPGPPGDDPIPSAALGASPDSSVGGSGQALGSPGFTPRELDSAASPQPVTIGPAANVTPGTGVSATPSAEPGAPPADTAPGPFALAAVSTLLLLAGLGLLGIQWAARRSGSA